MELTTQLTDTMNQVKITESTVYALEVERRRQELTLNELSSGDYTRLYKPVGRAYFLETILYFRRSFVFLTFSQVRQ